MDKLAHLVSVARGDSPADLVLADAKIVNVFSGEVESGDIAISEGKIAGIGDYPKAKEIIKLKGKYVLPGLLNGHTHLESSLLDVNEYALAVVPRGTLGIVTDLHELANVAGLSAIRYVLNCARHLPLDIFLLAPSCVPATHLETSGATITEDDISELLKWPGVIGLGEVMNFPGVIAGDPKVLAKIASAQGKIIDGHAPGVTGKELNAYLAAGIHSDHESVTLEEAREKLRRGMWVMIREGSSEKNLDSLLPLVNDKTYRRCFFVVDDRSCFDLLSDGDIDAVVRKAIKRGLDPIRSIQMATINTAEYFKLDGLGAIAPGYAANLIVTRDLSSLPIDMVFYQGKLVAEEGRPLFTPPKAENKTLTKTIKIKPFTAAELRIPAQGEIGPIIEVVPGQIITKKRVEKLRIENGLVLPDISRDILKLVVVERHKESGNIGRGLVKGFGLKRGALASSVAHDSHNIIAVGTNDDDIFTAIKEIERLGGGLVVASESRVIASLPLPIAGLLSDKPVEKVSECLSKLEEEARSLGTALPSPFALLSFLALPVIPELRLTDLGLVDVKEFKLIG